MSQQTTSKDLTDDLLALVQRHLYPGEAVAFNKDKKQLLQWAILWPATHLNDYGVTLPPERYKQLFLDILLRALQQGNTGNLKYRPAWLAKCIQSHFKIHWDEIYAEAKSARSLAEQALAMAGKIPVAKPADPVHEMALAARLVKGTGRSKKSVPKVPLNEQLKLV